MYEYGAIKDIQAWVVRSFGNSLVQIQFIVMEVLFCLIIRARKEYALNTMAGMMVMNVAESLPARAQVQVLIYLTLQDKFPMEISFLPRRPCRSTKGTR